MRIAYQTVMHHGLLRPMPRVCHPAVTTLLALAVLLLAACSKTAPAPPQMTPPTGGETINGTERIGWTQSAADAVELSLVKYAIYVDGTRSELAGVSCDVNASSGGFACSARLPTLTAGAHTLELASFVSDGGILESARSAALRVMVVTVVESTVSVGSDAFFDALSERGVSPQLIAGMRVRVELVAGGLNRPTDLAFAPDGRLFIAERGGTIRTVQDGGVSDPATVVEAFSRGDRLLAIAVDPNFARTHFVFAMIASGRFFTLARVREVSGTFGDQAVLLDNVPAAQSEPSASLRFGPDGKLYAAFDDGGDPQRVDDRSSSNGKILRLNADGTTPDDQAGASPIYVSASRSPAGLDWQRETGLLWVADRADVGMAAVSAEPRGAANGTRGAVGQRWSLPSKTVPAAAAFARAALIPALNGNLLVASGEGRHLLRVRFDPLNPSHVAATEPLLQDVVGPVVAVASGPDGAIYFATPRSVGRLVPE